MKNWILIVFLFVIVSDLYAFRVRGSIQGLASGESVYLYTDAPGTCRHKWQLSRLTDSVKVAQNGFFEFEVPNVPHGRLWLLRTRKKLIQYFFSADEDYEVQGRPGNVGLKTKIAVNGRDGLLAEDIMNVMENTHKTPVEKRMGIEWLKRFASEDAGVWALAYYYSVVHDLEWREVEEILPFIPEKQHHNPYYKVLRKYHERQKKVQPGEAVILSVGKKEAGKTMDFVKGHPFLIYAFTYEGSAFEKMYVNKARSLAELTRKFPESRLVLACPVFADSACHRALRQLTGKQVCIMPLETLRAANDWMEALWHSEGILLADPKGRVLTTVWQIGELQRILANVPHFVPHYTINGYVVGLGNGVAELVYTNEDGKSYSVHDTALIRNGHFRFEGVMKRPEYCNISIRNTDYPVGFWLGNEVIDVHIRAVVPKFSPEQRPILEGKIYGSRWEEEFQKLLNLSSEPEIEARVTAYASDPLTLFWIAYVLLQDYPLQSVEKWFGQLDPQLKKFREYQNIERQFMIQNTLQPGKMAPGFSLVNQKGEPVTLESFRGKYILLDFWASWCGPCRAEIPHLKKLWKTWNKQGLEILSISLDQKQKDWQIALEKEQMPWGQVWDQSEKVSELYNVQAIPHTVLINPDGKISMINLRGEALEQKLKESLKAGNDKR